MAAISVSLVSVSRARQELWLRLRDSGTANEPHKRRDLQRRSIGAQKSLCLPRATGSACKARKTPDNLYYAKAENACYISILVDGGEGGIRTHGTVTRTTVFETARLIQNPQVFSSHGAAPPHLA